MQHATQFTEVVIARWLRGEGVAIMRNMTTSCGIAMSQRSEDLGGLWKEWKEYVAWRVRIAKIYRKDLRLRKIQNEHICDLLENIFQFILAFIGAYFVISAALKDYDTDAAAPVPSHSAPTQSTPATASPAKPACECAPKQ